MKCTIKILDGSGTEILSKVFAEGVFRIGRSDFSDIVLSHNSVQRSQVELRVTEAAIYFTNMGTPDKVKVNDQPLETGELKDGDELKVGPYKITVFHGEREVAPESPALAEGVLPEEGALSPDPLQVPTPEMEPAHSSYVEGSAALKAETLVEIKPVVAKLVFMEGDRAGEDVFLDAFEVTLGRSKKADIFLDDEKLSRVHAKITRVGMGYRLIDLSSRNGTYVNGVRILEHPLNSFDEIQLGSCKIKFLIHDVMAQELGKRPALALVQDQTKSIALGAKAPASGQIARAELPYKGPPPPKNILQRALPNSRSRLLLGAVLVLGLAYLFIPSEKKPVEKKPEVVATAPQDTLAPAAPIPKEFLQLAEPTQRAVEAAYNHAQASAAQKQWEIALGDLKQIHDVLPYYKDSLSLQGEYRKRWEEAHALQVQARARENEKADIKLYLEEGMEYLKSRDWEKAADAFQNAILLDPKNEMAAQGLRAVAAKVSRFEDIPPEHDPEAEKIAMVRQLFKTAVAAFKNKSYQEAIDAAEKIRAIELKGDTAYLNEAKQIIDQARLLQKEEFEPFLLQAKEKYAEGDYSASRDLCEEMLRRDPSYSDGKECALRAKKQLVRLAREAYTHGYILESMNRIEDAKRYWNRAKSYVRPGDEYYEKIMKKLDSYQ